MDQTSSSAHGRGPRLREPATVRCRHCGAEQSPAPFCSACDRLLALPPDADHYQVFGIPRRLALDTAELSRRYYDLSRRLHPDGHSAGSAEDLDAAMRNTAALTRAYRALRDPVARALDWLDLHGEKLGDDNRVPPALAAQVFEVQEKLEELRHSRGDEQTSLAAEVRSERDGLTARAEALQQKLAANFDAWNADGADSAALLRELKAILSERAYLATLIRDVGAALDQVATTAPEAASAARSH